MKQGRGGVLSRLADGVKQVRTKQVGEGGGAKASRDGEEKAKQRRRNSRRGLRARGARPTADPAVIRHAGHKTRAQAADWVGPRLEWLTGGGKKQRLKGCSLTVPPAMMDASKRKYSRLLNVFIYMNSLLRLGASLWDLHSSFRSKQKIRFPPWLMNEPQACLAIDHKEIAQINFPFVSTIELKRTNTQARVPYNHLRWLLSPRTSLEHASVRGNAQIAYTSSTSPNIGKIAKHRRKDDRPNYRGPLCHPPSWSPSSRYDTQRDCQTPR